MNYKRIQHAVTLITTLNSTVFCPMLQNNVKQDVSTLIIFLKVNKDRYLCYYSVQTLLPARLLSKNLKIKIYK